MESSAPLDGAISFRISRSWNEIIFNFVKNAFYILSVGARTLSVTSLNITTFRMTTYDIQHTNKKLTQHKRHLDAECLIWQVTFFYWYAKCRYAKCRGALLVEDHFVDRQLVDTHCFKIDLSTNWRPHSFVDQMSVGQMAFDQMTRSPLIWSEKV